MLSEFIRSVADECGYTVASGSIVNATDDLTKQLVAMANRLAQEIAHDYIWPQLRKTATITTVANQANYNLPNDFSFYHFDTFYNQSDEWKLYGPLTSQEYAERIGYNWDPVGYSEFHIEGIGQDKLTIYPTPSASGETIIFRYSCDRPIRPKTWAAATPVTAGEYCFYDSYYWTANGTGTTGIIPLDSDNDPSFDGGIYWTPYTGAYNTFQADTDIFILNERILSLGLMERFKELKKIDFMPRFQEQLAQVAGRQIASKEIFTGCINSSRAAWARNGKVHFRT